MPKDLLLFPLFGGDFLLQPISYTIKSNLKKPISKKIKRGTLRFLAFVSPTLLSSIHHSPTLPRESGSGVIIFAHQSTAAILRISSSFLISVVLLRAVCIL